MDDSRNFLEITWDNASSRPIRDAAQALPFLPT
jgi:hypothetical protein